MATAFRYRSEALVIFAFVGACELGAEPICAQSTGDQSRFEVASIKPTNATVPMMHAPELHHGTMTASNVTLRIVIASAYGITTNRVFGPEGLDKDRFDFLAKAADGTPDARLRPLLQSLLKERFRLESHVESREMPVYDLQVAKGGPKMSVYPSAARIPAGLDSARVDELRGSPTMSRLAAILSGPAGRPVLDKTGLSERYNIILKFTGGLSPDGNGPEFGAPDLFTAIREQLGLQLRAAKAKLDVIVVDHIDPMPSEN